MKLLLLILLIANTLFATNESFSHSKKELRKIYRDHQRTIYCDCKYNYKNKKNMIDKKSCGYIPRNKYTKKGKLNIRANRIEWEHAVPAENFGRQFKCWRDGDVRCVTSKGKHYKGRKCCTKVNKQYRIMQADMHNLFPSIGELNADRKNYRYDFELPTRGQYGQCEFNVLFKQRRARIREEIRGRIARGYLYFHKRYKMRLSKQELKKYQAWNKEYPPIAWEIERNKRIAKVQGNINEFAQ